MLRRPVAEQDQTVLQRRIGTTLRVYRTRLGLSQEELAVRAHLARSYLADVERGARNPLLMSIARLTAALGVSLAAFFATFESVDGYEDEPPPSRKVGKG